MSKAEQPRLNNSNSVCVEICLTLSADRNSDIDQRIQAWIDSVWIPNNVEWVQVWKTGANLEIVADTQILNYKNDFFRSPEIFLRDKDNLLMRLHIKWPSRNWRDWLVLKILPDVRDAFPEIKDEPPVYVRRCTAPI